MAYCSNCGAKVDDGAKFCQECGHALQNSVSGNQTQRQEEFVGKIYKCPNCGEHLKSFTTVCPSCGYEIRGANNQSFVKEFAKQLDEIEYMPFIKGIFIGDTKSKKANFIMNYTVPNTKEDLLEFMIFATSNINYDDLDDGGEKKAIADAWMAKIEQIYEKAKSSFGNDADFARIEEMYKKRNEAVKRKKLKLILAIVGFIIFFIAVGFIIYKLPQV